MCNDGVKVNEVANLATGYTVALTVAAPVTIRTPSGPCVVRTIGTMTLSTSLSMSPTNEVVGSMTNWALSPGPATVSGSSADDLTAATENTDWYHVVDFIVDWVISVVCVALETGHLMTSVIPIATSAPHMSTLLSLGTLK